MIGLGNIKENIKISLILILFLYVIIKKNNKIEHFGFCCSSIVKAVKKKAKKAVKAVKKVAKKLDPSKIISKVFQYVWDKLPLFKPLRSALNYIKGLYGKIKQKIIDFKNKTNDFVKKGMNLPTTIKNKVSGSIDSSTKGATDKLESGVSFDKKKLSKFVDDKVITPIQEAIDKMIKSIKKLIETIPNTITKVFTFLTDKIKGVISYVIDAPKKLVIKIKDYINTKFKPLINKIRKMFGMKPL